MDNIISGSITSEKFSCEKILVKRKCKYCDFMTDLRVTLDDHFWRYHKTFQNYSRIDLKVKAYPCNSCDFTTYSILVWSLHRNKCLYVCKDEIKCSKSPYVSSKNDSQKQEIKLDDSEPTVKLERTLDNNFSLCYIGSKKFFCCKACEYKSYSRWAFNVHFLNHHTAPEEIEWVKCDQCAYKAKTKSFLNRHISLKHARQDLVYHDCNHCSYKTAIKGHLKRHIVTKHTDHEEIKWFQCDQCEYKGKTKGNLQQHVKLTHARKDQIQYRCNHCSFNTIVKGHLKRHILGRHTDPDEIKFFECDQCRYKSYQKSHLRQHIKQIHGKNLTYFKCDRCAYKSKAKRTLEYHIKVRHTRENLVQHKCSQCSFTTVHKNSLQKHIKGQHEDPGQIKWYECDLCGYKTKRKDNLKQHFLRHP